jgi:hypothetical protein
MSPQTTRLPLAFLEQAHKRIRPVWTKVNRVELLILGAVAGLIVVWFATWLVYRAFF